MLPSVTMCRPHFKELQTAAEPLLSEETLREGEAHTIVSQRYGGRGRKKEVAETGVSKRWKRRGGMVG